MEKGILLWDLPVSAFGISGPTLRRTPGWHCGLTVSRGGVEPGVMPEIAEEAAAPWPPFPSHRIDPTSTAQAVVAGPATGPVNGQGFGGRSQFGWAATEGTTLAGVGLEVAAWTH
jgi:hypothetical protein